MTLTPSAMVGRAVLGAGCVALGLFGLYRIARSFDAALELQDALDRPGQG
jgi:hypothetical protein